LSTIMPGNSFGQLFSITSFGESHGGGVGVVIDGCPAGIPIKESEIQLDLDRRKPGQSSITTPRKEEDTIRILSGVFEGVTTGTPIMMLAANKDVRSEDYNDLHGVFRPSHADYTYIKKYGVRDWRGSGRASARETLARVAAGAIAKKLLRLHTSVEIVSYVEQVGHIKAHVDTSTVTIEDVEKNIVRCPDAEAALKMIKLIEEVQADGDSIGGIIRGIIRNVPPGLGEPVFGKLNSDLGAAMLSINAVKGFEIGSGFECVSLRGSEHNDALLVDENGTLTFTTNHAGGVLGGISSGQDILFRVAFKPVSTISKPQQTVNLKGKQVELQAAGRHDPCVLPRAVPIVDAMAALVICDHLLRHHAQTAQIGEIRGT
jgi:chorismate synthase